MLDVLAVGELNVDLILAGLKNPPVMGREMLAESCTLCMGSSTAICACVCASLGLKTGFFGMLGSDAYGEVVGKTLRRYGVDDALVRRSDDYRTGITVSMTTGDDRAMVTYFGDTINGFSAEDVPLEKALARHIHVGSFFLQSKLQKGLPALFEKAHALGMTTSLDAGWDDTGTWGGALYDTLRHTDVFFPNESEAQAITGLSDPAQAAEELARRGRICVVKLGAKGSILRASDGTRAFAPGYPVKPVDTTGAGDSFNAGFLRAWLRGEPATECLRYGNAVGAVSVTRIGGSTDCPTQEDVAALLK